LEFDTLSRNAHSEKRRKLKRNGDGTGLAPQLAAGPKNGLELFHDDLIIIWSNIRDGNQSAATPTPPPPFIKLGGDGGDGNVRPRTLSRRIIMAAPAIYYLPCSFALKILRGSSIGRSNF
jgi:hypothetical protein